MDGHLEGRRALIVGGSRGIGRKTAIELSEAGASIALIARGKEGLENTLDQLSGQPEQHYAVSADLQVSGRTGEALREIREYGDPIDVIIHVIGGSIGVKDPFSSIEDWEDVWRFNLGTAIEINRRVIPRMQERGWGRVIHLSSTATDDAGAPVPYAAVKAALDAYVRNLGRRVAADGVIMAALSPSIVIADGNNWSKAMRDKPEWTREFLAENVGIERAVQPEEIASAIGFLTTEAAQPFAGAVLPFDGGWR